MVQGERAQGRPLLLLDAGNALFRAPREADAAAARARATLLLEEMDAMGTRAMAVGARDLALGVALLQAPRPHLRPLSVNLVDAAGRRVFAPSLLLEEGGVRVGVVGVSPEGAVPASPGVRGLPPLPAALDEARRLRREERADVVVVLAALPLAQAQLLGEEAGRSVDLVLQSGEGRPPGSALRAGRALLLAPGERGRQLARARLSLPAVEPGGVRPAPFVDLAEAARAREALAGLDASLRTLEARLAAAPDAATRAALEETRRGFAARRSLLEQAARGGEGPGARSLQLDYLSLGPEVAGDPALQARVQRLETPGPLAH